MKINKIYLYAIFNALGKWARWKMKKSWSPNSDVLVKPEVCKQGYK